MGNYYAVRHGRKPGIYSSWAECKEQTYKFSGATFKFFEDLDDALDYIAQAERPIDYALPFAYVDGSFSKSRGVYGYGGFIQCDGFRQIIQHAGSNAVYLPEQHIAGECLGALQVMFTASKRGIDELNLFYDYIGIENWALHAWEARTPIAQYYADTYDLMSHRVQIHFCKVNRHAGIIGNEIADLLAKEAVGAPLRRVDVMTLAEFRRGHVVVDPTTPHGFRKADGPVNLTMQSAVSF